MQPFASLHGIAASLPAANIDTDKIVPARFLKTVSRKGLGTALFRDLRFADDGTPDEDFVLNAAPWDAAVILIAGDNFGCGSSREHAPWALLDFGIRCVIAPSFGDIFYNNCFKNGILPIQLDPAHCAELAADAADPLSCAMRVDLNAQNITRANGAALPFLIDPGHRDALLAGRDEITETLNKAAAIDAFEAAFAPVTPWVYRGLSKTAAAASHT